uniref:Uncharacterized protein n=1 Tax=Trichogramma kaykai TaxID=54128 RepID=A0ABD2WAJ4_9HYME
MILLASIRKRDLTMATWSGPALLRQLLREIRARIHSRCCCWWPGQATVCFCTPQTGLLIYAIYTVSMCRIMYTCVESSEREASASAARLC